MRSKLPITTAADDSLKYFCVNFQRKCLGIACESSAKQTIHMKCQDIFSKKKKKINTVVCYKFCLALSGLSGSFGVCDMNTSTVFVRFS